MLTELITPEDMRRVEAMAPSHGVSLASLMENAGRAVVAEIISRYPMRPVTVLCGPGNNGGDGFVIARMLDDIGWSVSVHLLGDSSKLKGDALANARKWPRAIKSIDAPFEGSLIVDALFGIGLTRDFPEDLATRITRANVPVVAVDIPSGIDGLSGEVRGSAVKADLTVTFFRMKPAHVVEPGRSYCGEIIVNEIGIPHQVIASLPQTLWVNEKPVLPQPNYNTHKFSRGGAIIWSGDALHSGAARLAAQAAQRSGAGIVCLGGPSNGLMIHAHHVTSIILQEMQGAADLEALFSTKKYNACCVGPASGINDAIWRVVMTAVATGKNVVLDADALTLYAQNREIGLRLTSQRETVSVVMTPHEGEFARMFPDLAEGPTSRLERARAAATRTNVIMVLKGEGTIIAHPDGRAAIQTDAPEKLAMAGSGDVLAGLITGLMAQGMAPFEAAMAGVWLHTEAARSIPRDVVIAEDLVANLAR